MVHQPGDQRRDIFRQLVLESGIVGDMDLADPGDLPRSRSDIAHARTGDQQVDLAVSLSGFTAGYEAAGETPSLVPDE